MAGFERPLTFPITGGKFAAWTGTANFIQRQGYFFKDAIYLIDDYKPELIKITEILKVLQNYSDRQGRGRLKADATTNVTRPIRGLLVSTGEDVPENTPSAVARSIIIDVPQQSQKDLERGSRCQVECQWYRAITTDFLTYVLENGRQRRFGRWVGFLRAYFYRGIAGQQNDSRIANNFALLAAGFVEMARYFKDVWPEWKQAVRQFVTQDLIAIRDEMVVTTREQQPSQVFWSILNALVEHERVNIEGPSSNFGKAVCIGKPYYISAEAAAQRRHDLVHISTQLALAEVNRSLREQGRPELKITTKNLLGQLRQDGRLFDHHGGNLNAGTGDNLTSQVRIDGSSKHAFITRTSLLRSPNEGSGAPRSGFLPKEGPPLAG